MSFGKSLDTINYCIHEIREVEPNVYLVVYQKDRYKKYHKGPFLKMYIVDATKD